MISVNKNNGGLSEVVKSPLFKKIMNYSSWTFFSTIIARGLSLLVYIFLARILGAEVYGKFSILQSTLAMIGTFSGMGIGMTATKFIAENRNRNPLLAGKILALCETTNFVSGLLFAIGIFIMAPYLSTNVLGDPSLEPLFKIACLYLFFITLDSAQVGTIAGLEAFKPRAISQLITSILFCATAVIGTLVWGINGAIASLVVQGFSSCVINFLIISKWSKKQGIKIVFRGCWSERKILYTFSLPLLISSVFIIPVEWLLNALLVKSSGGYTQLGIFNASRQWFTILTFIPLTLSTITMPMLSNALGNKKYENYKRLVVSNTIVMGIITLLFATPIYIYSDFFMGIFGEEFVGDNEVLKLTCMYAVLFSLNIVIGQVIWSSGMVRAGIILAAFRSLVLVGAYLFIESDSATGLMASFVWSYVALTIVQGVLAITLIRKLLKENIIQHGQNSK